MQYSILNGVDDTEVVSLFRTVFADAEGESEGQVIGQLVSEMLGTTAADDIVTCIAIQDDAIVAATLLTRLKMSNEQQGFILSPMAVATSMQGQGVGQQLIRFAIEQLKTQGADVLLTYGDPNFYGKVGFEPISEQVIAAPFPLSHPHGWIGQSLNGQTIEALAEPVQCVAALNQPQYW
ncbi:GNAT family N-acetyltransferase [Shewanella waksmanii]|uniref:GNAT family N-acetyltransferase n=1 Tax=Shewanella waksmanii TaxID=213783 RepID=UPI00048C631D|nr:N-acetyltransferase [Shewanella waksmanii]